MPLFDTAAPRRKLSPFCLPYLALPMLLLGAGIARGGAEEPKAAASPSAASEQAAYEKEIRPLFEQFCLGCHGPQSPAGGVDLSDSKTVPSLQRDQTTWRKALTQIRERAMPPRGMPQPTEPQREQLALWLAHTLDNVPDSLLPKNPGRVLIHRLSRTEYNNTVRDLFGISSNPADRFPPDGGGGGGFDNNADTLFIPPILMERYLETAGEILNEAKPERIFFVRPSKTMTSRAAGKKIIEHFARRAYRRPVETPELSRLMSLFDGASHRGESFENSVKFALKAVLVSPSFLFRAQRAGTGEQPYPIGDYELASRLSYFLWASLPDEELFRLAAQKRLRDPKVLEQQVRRMLTSPKSRALADNFPAQWLRVRDLYTVARPDPRRYPSFTPSLRDAMYSETITFFDGVLRQNRSLLHLLDADYTYLNAELAKHYGIEGVHGPDMRRVTLKDGRRGGVLTQASVLTLTSYPRRTSPVLRGKWVLEEILGTPPPPPPPNAGALPPDDSPKEGLTFRQRLEQHREKPQCFSCHARMDPLGFGLENFDAIGRWREEIGGTPVDATGVLATGEKFSGPVDLKKHLMARRDDFTRNLVEKMLSYALGRGLEPYDLPAVRRIKAAVEKDGYRSATLIREVVRSYPFQYRKDL